MTILIWIFLILIIFALIINWLDEDEEAEIKLENAEKIHNYCPNCNKPQNDNAIFCEDCGTQILLQNELVTIAYCEKCESEFDESFKFCQKDGYELVLKEKEIDESPKNINDEPKDSNEIDKDKVTDLPMNWYRAFTYAMLPLFIIYFAMTVKWWGGDLTVLLIVPTAFLIIGHHRMSRWAPTFFNFYIFTSFLPILIDYNNYRMDFGVEVETEVLFLLSILIWVFWSVPNYIYFNKRKHLFVN